MLQVMLCDAFLLKRLLIGDSLKLKMIRLMVQLQFPFILLVVVCISTINIPVECVMTKASSYNNSSYEESLWNC